MEPKPVVDPHIKRGIEAHQAVFQGEPWDEVSKLPLHLGRVKTIYFTQPVMCE